jgi:hypothetical protein
VSDSVLERADAAGAPPPPHGRKLVIAVAVLSGVLGLVPVPLVGDLAIDLARTFLLRRLARRRQLELSARGALVVCGIAEVSVGRLAISTALVLAMRLAWRRLTRALFFLLRFDDMARTFLLGTLFDHYCAHHHQEEREISLERAERLRRAIAAASDGAWAQVLSALFQRVFSDLVRAGVALPRALWSLASSVLRDDKSDRVERVIDEDLEGFFGRVTHLVEQELAAAGQATIQALCEAFDQAWAREAPTPSTPGAAS